jgi:plasmid maintenance system antidote protein VapI
MSTSLKRRFLSKPKRGEAIDLFDLAYVRSRNRNKAHSFLLEEFEKCDFSKAELAKMLRKRPEQITRWLAGPGNITLDTISDLLFALRGDFITIQCSDDLSRAKSNNRQPDWLQFPIMKSNYVKSKASDTSVTIYSMHLQKTSSEKEVKYDRYRSTGNNEIYEVI